MAKSKPQKTAADYVAIAAGPVLIMLLVGSLAFFVLEVSYTGRFESRLRWIMFWFVMASVLIARIAIEQGSGHAAAYGIALSAATLLVMFKFVDAPFVALPLLGVIWWCANKLTWDCTLIDDGEDASGEGLLAAGAIAGSTESQSEKAEGEQGGEQDEFDEASTQRVSHYKRLLPKGSERRGRPHAPGLWVVYFSLVALPMFGVGQTLIPAEDAGERSFAFRLVWIYTAAALALLLTTSFLGLRRYLRQRRLTMPAAMTGAWMGIGGSLIAVILVLCMLLPRPDAEYSLTAALDRFGSKDRDASKYALLDDDSGKGEGRRIGEPDDNEDQPEKGGGGKKGRDGNQAGQAKQEQGGPGEGEGDKAGGDQKGDQKQAGGAEERKGEQANDRAKAQEENNPGEKQQAAQKNERQPNENAEADGKPEKGDPQQAQDDDQRNEGAAKKANGDDSKSAENRSDARQSSSRSPSSVGQMLSNMAEPLKWIIYAAIALVVLFLIVRHRRALLDGWRSILADLAGFFRNLFGRRSGSEQNAAEDQAGGVPVPRKPFAEYDDPFAYGSAYESDPREVLAHTFEALAAFAQEQGVEHTADQTPLEFARLVGSAFPEMSADVRKTASLYARTAYADYRPTRESYDLLQRVWQQMTNAACI